MGSGLIGTEFGGTSPGPGQWLGKVWDLLILGHKFWRGLLFFPIWAINLEGQNPGFYLRKFNHIWGKAQFF